MLIDEAGNHKMRVHNGESVAKPRTWHVTLVPSDDPEKVKLAKWLFQTYADQDIGLRLLANDLNMREIPGPRGGLWHVGTIREMLKNETYAGDVVWPKRSMGKYHRIAGTEIKQRSGKPGVRFNEAAERIEHRGILPALVDRQTWERVQEKLRRRRRRTTSHNRRTWTGSFSADCCFATIAAPRCSGSVPPAGRTARHTPMSATSVPAITRKGTTSAATT
jgi:hypothetical protein